MLYLDFVSLKQMNEFEQAHSVLKELISKFSKSSYLKELDELIELIKSDEIKKNKLFKKILK